MIIATNENGTDHATRLKNQWPAKGRSKTSSRANLASYVPLITADIDDDPKALFRLMEVDGYLDTFVPTPKPVPTPEASEASPSPTPVEESPADPAG